VPVSQGDSTPRLARYTWRRQWPAEACKGMVDGVSGLAAFAAMRSLGAPEWVAVLIAVAGQALWIVAPGLEALTARIDHRKAILWLGVAANVPLLCVAFVHVNVEGAEGAGRGWWRVFVAAVVVLTALDALYIPLRGAMIRANYAERVRGLYFGLLSAVSKATSIVSSKGAGLLLDHDPRMLRVVFPVAGCFGLLEHWQLARVRWHRAETPAVGGGSGFFRLLRDGWGILRADRDFRVYEIGFSLYGLGFLMSQPLFSIFEEKHLQLSYDELTWAVGVADPAAYLAAVLLLGPRIPKIGIVKLTAAAFLGLSLYMLLLTQVGAPWQYVFLRALFGVVMAGVNLGWNLGPLAFAPPGRARAYAAVHVCIVGIRVAIGPALGYALATVTGPRLVFGVSCVVVAAGCVTTSLLAKRVR
jgi:hypothetical protein